MPYSPVTKFPEIIDNLKKRFGKRDIGTESLWNEVVFVTGSVKDGTIKNTISIMERLGYIRSKPNGRFDLADINPTNNRPIGFIDDDKQVKGILKKMGLK